MTKQKAKLTMPTDLSGRVERITFSNEENGFTIARVIVHGRHEPVTVIGNMMAPVVGEILEMRGEWSTHPKFGEQFKVIEYKTKVPATVYGIRKYLGSGMIKGLGPVMADRIVDRFGKNTLDIIENEIERLAEVEGIGKKRIAMIAKAWDEQREIRDVMLFLQSYGVSAGYAAKIFRQYGKQAVAVVRENPYRLAGDIFGIGFLTADQIAAKMGIPRDAAIRVEAGVLYILNQQADEGHVYFPYEALVSKSCEILDIERESVMRALGVLISNQKVIMEDLDESFDPPSPKNRAVFLARYHLFESGVAERLNALIRMAKSIRGKNKNA